MRRAGAAVALVLTVLMVLAQPARAEVPAGSTRSEISAVSAAGASPEVSIVGGDEYVRLVATPDHELIVAGYSGEPYLRFARDGTVSQNDRSPATALNNDRFGTADVSSYDAHADPQWSVVGTGGTFQWHDHRIHSMVTGPLPPAPDGTVFDWTIPISVDGSPGEIRGALIQESSGTGWLCVTALVLLVVGLVVAGRRRGLLAARLTASTAAAAATLVMVGERVAVGGVFTGGPEALIPVAVAVVASVVSWVARRPNHQLLAAGIVPIVLSGWLLTRAVVLWGSVVVSWWAAAVQRGLVVLAAAAAIATAVLALEVWRAQLSRPRVSRRAA